MKNLISRILNRLFPSRLHKEALCESCRKYLEKNSKTWVRGGIYAHEGICRLETERELAI